MLENNYLICIATGNELDFVRDENMKLQKQMMSIIDRGMHE